MTTLTCEDNMALMARFPDKYFELAIVDPPYGINVVTDRSFGDPLRKDGTIRHGTDKRNGAKIIRKPSQYSKKQWDKQSPTKEYFNELIRVSKNQIIWGANHFISKIPFDSSCWIVWDKVNGSNDFADCELAWTSFDTAVRKFTFMWNGMLQGSSKDGRILEGNILKKEKRIHPTQKPVALYRWLLQNYAKKGDKILDTHLGSMSIAIACDMEGFDLTGCELDPEYYRDGIKRLETFRSQTTLF